MAHDRARRSRDSENVPATARAPLANSPLSRPGGKAIVVAIISIFLLGLIPFANSFYGVFVLDDVFEIEQNQEMNHLLPPWRAALAGRVIPARPIPYYTFAIDTAIWKRRPMGYHLFNLAIHLGSAALLFSIVRRTLQSPKLVERYGPDATRLAFAIAALWVVHPLQTQAVTYIYQRLESLMSFLFLTAFYCFVRSKDSPHPLRWLSGSVVATTLALLSKESAVAIPPLLFLYDVVFWTDSWTATVRSRHRYYIALLLTFLPLLALLAYQSKAYEEFRTPRSSIGYALSQPGVMLRYLQLCVYPTGQCLDYLRPMATEPSEIVGPLIVVLGLLTAATVGILRRRPWGWLLAAFFLPLLPTSSFIPVIDLINEHRMYLPLAAVSTAVVLGCFECYRWILARTGKARPFGIAFTIVFALAITCLSCATHRRNRVYQSRIAMWEDVVSKAPHNSRAYENLGSAYLVAGDTTRASEAARRILADPDHRHRHFRGHLILGSAMLDSGDRQGAIEHLTKAIEQHPPGVYGGASAYISLGVAVQPTNPKQAAELYAGALEIDPTNVVAMINLANSRARESDYVTAARILEAALEIEPENARAREKLSFVLADMQAAEKRAGS